MVYDRIGWFGSLLFGLSQQFLQCVGLLLAFGPKFIEATLHGLAFLLQLCQFRRRNLSRSNLVFKSFNLFLNWD